MDPTNRPPKDATAHAEREAAELEKLRQWVIADIARVAEAIRKSSPTNAANLLGHGLSLRHYLQEAGPYSYSTLHKIGPWSALCQAAGVRCSRGQAKRRRTWQKTKRAAGAMSPTQFDAVVNRFLGKKSPPPGILCMMGYERRHGKGIRRSKRIALQAQTPALEKSEVIADIRQVSLGAGLLDPRLLTWATYRRCGGLYTYEQTAALGGFNALRRCA